MRRSARLVLLVVSVFVVGLLAGTLITDTVRSVVGAADRGPRVARHGTDLTLSDPPRGKRYLVISAPRRPGREAAPARPSGASGNDAMTFTVGALEQVYLVEVELGRTWGCDNDPRDCQKCEQAVCTFPPPPPPPAPIRQTQDQFMATYKLIGVFGNGNAGGK